MAELTRRSFTAAVGLGLGTLVTPALAAPPEERVSFRVPLSFGVATVDDHPARDGEWITEQIAQMESLFGPLGVHPAEVALRTLGASYAHMETRSDRDALASEVRPGVVNIFVVGSLRDVDDPSVMRRGVHWRNRATPAIRYVILAAEAMPTVLAHEMGHYFGNGHSATRDNLMSYDRSGGPVFIDAAQARIIQAAARQAFASHELVPVAPP